MRLSGNIKKFRDMDIIDSIIFHVKDDYPDMDEEDIHIDSLALLQSGDVVACISVACGDDGHLEPLYECSMLHISSSVFDSRDIKMNMAIIDKSSDISVYF